MFYSMWFLGCCYEIACLFNAIAMKLFLANQYQVARMFWVVAIRAGYWLNVPDSISIHKLTIHFWINSIRYQLTWKYILGTVNSKFSSRFPSICTNSNSFCTPSWFILFSSDLIKFYYAFRQNQFEFGFYLYNQCSLLRELSLHCYGNTSAFLHLETHVKSVQWHGSSKRFVWVFGCCHSCCGQVKHLLAGREAGCLS